MRFSSGAISALLVAVFGATASAVEVPGGRKAITDCYATVDVDADVTPTSTRVIECTDGDPRCDHDGARDRSCRFRVRLCVNRPNAKPTCIPPAPPSALVEVRPRGLAAQLGIDVPPLDRSACGAFLDNVPVLLRGGGKQRGRRRLRIVAIGPEPPRRDRNVVKLVCKPCVGSCARGSTTTTTPASTTTTTVPPCEGGCPPAQIVMQSTAGVLAVGTLAAFPFPAGVTTVIDIGTAGDGCRHDAIVPAGGYTVPLFCIPALGFTSQVTATGCVAGGTAGMGAFWDTAAGAAPDADVVRVGDTSDGACDPGGQPCTPAGAGGNTLGNVDTTRGDQTIDAPGLHARLDIPARSLTWVAADASCPDADGTYDAGTDTLVTD
ncbi:MAG TPA: hypothetical protein VKA21_00710, partial [Candidatus Binatia bacterium]|nr:hypothetical protein [Candidatus Binatia bacterium]